MYVINLSISGFLQPIAIDVGETSEHYYLIIIYIWVYINKIVSIKLV